MPVHEIALPVGAKNIDPQLPVVLRSSKDGNIPVVQLFGGDKFVGDILEGQWAKGDDGVIVGPHTSLITSGQLEITGKAAVAANRDYGWLNGKAPFLIVQDSYVDVHMEVPAVTPANLVQMGFLLRKNQAIDQPDTDDDFIRVVLRRTTGGLTQIYANKNIAGSGTALYDFATVTNAEGTFRIKFRPNDDKIDIYFHDGSGDVVDTDELTLLDDDFDLTFLAGYPAYMLETEDTTIRTVNSEKVEVYYPNTGISYNQDVADLGKGDVKCYDTMGEASEALWMRVYSEEHDFTGDCVIENGLVRLVVDEAAEYGLGLYYWTGSAWSQPLDRLRPYLDTDTTGIEHPFLKAIKMIDRNEEIQLRVRFCSSATESDSVNCEMLISLARGDYHLIFKIDSVIPSQRIRFMYGNSTPLRWGYLGDADTKGIGDDDLSLTVTNTTMTDNFMVKFDDAGSTVIGFIGTNQKPAAGSNAFYTYQGNEISIRCIAVADFEVTEIHVGLIPFADVANLFEEAEDASLAGGAVIDEFTDEFTVDSSAQYEEDTASFTWSSLELHCAVDGKQIRLKALECSSEDDYFQFGIKWKPVAQNGSSQCGSTLIFHSDRTVRAGNLDQPNNGYYVILDQDAGSAALYKNVAGTPTLLDSVSGLTFTLGTYYSVTVKFHESVAGSIAVWIGGVERLNATSEFTFEEGAIGIGNTFGTSTWDLFRVYDTDEAESSGKSAVMLDALNETVRYWITGGTTIPVGRYLAIVRAKDTAQIANDLVMYVYNETDGRYVHEKMGPVTKTCTSSYTYHGLVFDIIADDAGDSIKIQAYKGGNGPNTICVDYFLIIPITDGESYVQDIAHNAVRTLDQGFRLTDTAMFEIFGGMGFSYSSIYQYTDTMAIAAVEAAPLLTLKDVTITGDVITNRLPDQAAVTVLKKNNIIYAVKDGTVISSGTSAATVIQAAIDSLTDGGEIFIKKGTYSITSTIAIDKTADTSLAISIVGEGAGTILDGYTPSLTADILRIKTTTGNIRRVTISNLHFKIKQGYSGIYCEKFAYSQITDCYFIGGGVSILNGNSILIKGNLFFHADPGGLAAVLLTGTDYCSIMNNFFGEDLTGGIHLKTASVGNVIVGNTFDHIKGKGIYIEDSNSVRTIISNNGLRCRTSVNSGDTPIYSTAHHTTVIGNTIYPIATTFAGSGIDLRGERQPVIGNYVRGAGAYGIAVGGRSLVKGNFVEHCERDGIRPTSGTDHRTIIEGNILKNNDQSGGGYAGITISSATYVMVLNNICFDDQGTKTQTYGILIAGTSDYITVIGNDLRSNQTGPLNLVGNNNIVKSNMGFITENQNIAIIVNTTSSIQSPHGLAQTPTVVIVTGRHEETRDLIVSARDSTNITIATGDAANVTADRTVDWHAIYKP